MQILIKTFTNKTITLDVEPDDTIESIITKAQEKSSLPTDQDTFIFGGKLLNADRTFADYNIKDDSVIHIVPKLRGGEDQVFIKCLNGKTITLNMSISSTTVGEMKKMILEKEGIAVNAQKIIFAGKELADDKTLNDYNFQKSSTIHFIIKQLTG